MFSRFIIPASLLTALGLGFGGGWVYSWDELQAHKNEILHLQEFCEDLALSPSFVTVKTVVDGDTFRTDGGVDVRLVGSDAPEICKFFSTGKPREEGCIDEAGGQNAKTYLKDLIEGKEIILIGDPVYGDQDDFGRKLRYAYIEDTMVDLDLISNGYAPVYSKLRTTAKFYDELQEAEINAREKKLGIWGDGSAEKLGLQ